MSPILTQPINGSHAHINKSYLLVTTMVSANDVNHLFLQAMLSRGLMFTMLAWVLLQKSVSAAAVNGSCFFLHFVMTFFFQ